MNPNPAPGWYQRPEDPSRVEYWDGAAWHVRQPATGSPTATTRPAADLATATTRIATIPGTTPPAASAARPFAQWLRTPAGMITAIIVGIVVLSVLLTSRGGVVLVIIASFTLTGYAIVRLIRRARAGQKATGSLKVPIAALAMAFVLFMSGTASAGTQGAASNDAGNANPSTRTLVDEAPAEPSNTPTPSPTPTVEVTVEKVEVNEPIPYTTSNIDDPGMDKGTTRVATAGVNGTKTIVFEITSEDGVEVSRTTVEERISVAPVNEVIAVGSKEPVVAPPPAPAPAPAGNCDSNYTGACVPIASDVDCAGGSGDGPAYVQGPVRIVGTDVYDLDRDGDGIACD